MNSFRISLCEVLLGCNINCLELNQFQDRFLCRQKSSIFSTRFTKTLEWIPKAASICPKPKVVYKKQDWKGFEYQRPWWLISFLAWWSVNLRKEFASNLPKSKRKILKDFDPSWDYRAEILQKIAFWEIWSQDKLLLRLTDLYN